MLPYTPIIQELMLEQTLRERRLDSERTLPAKRREPARPRRLKSALASALVRVGLRLDPAAGEDLRALALSPAGQDGRNES